MALGLLVLYQTYAHGDEEEASKSGELSIKPEQGCDLHVDRTPSLTSSLAGAPTHDTTPRKGDDEASLAGRRPLLPRRGILEDTRGSDEFDEIISMAAARYNAQMGPGASSPILASLELSEAPSPPPASSKVGGVAKEAGQWDETLDLFVLVQPAPPFAILEASSDWLGFYGFSAAEVVGSPLCSVVEGAASEGLDLERLIEEAAARGEPVAAVRTHYTKRRRAFCNHMRVALETEERGPPPHARRVRVRTEKAVVLWTPRSSPCAGGGPELPWESALPGSPRRPSPRVEGRKAVDQPGGARRAAMRRHSMTAELNACGSPRLPASSPLYVPPTPRSVVSMPSSPLLLGDYSRVRQQQILRDSRHGNGQGGSPLLQTPPCDLPLPPCDLPPTLLQSGSREVAGAAGVISPPGEVSVNGRSFKRRSGVTAPTNLGAPATGDGLNLPAPIVEDTVEESTAQGFRAFVDTALRLPTG